MAPFHDSPASTEAGERAPSRGSQLGSPSPATEVLPTSNALPARNWSWVPVRSLTPRHRERILAHLVALRDHDRYLPFPHEGIQRP